MAFYKEKGQLDRYCKQIQNFYPYIFKLIIVACLNLTAFVQHVNFTRNYFSNPFQLIHPNLQIITYLQVPFTYVIIYLTYSRNYLSNGYFQFIN